MNNFYAQYKYIKPYLQKKNVNEEDIGKKSYLQSPEDRAKLVILLCCVINVFIVPFSFCECSGRYITYLQTVGVALLKQYTKSGILKVLGCRRHHDSEYDFNFTVITTKSISI